MHLNAVCNGSPPHAGCRDKIRHYRFVASNHIHYLVKVRVLLLARTTPSCCRKQAQLDAEQSCRAWFGGDVTSTQTPWSLHVRSVTRQALCMYLPGRLEQGIRGMVNRGLAVFRLLAGSISSVAQKAGARSCPAGARQRSRALSL